MRPVRKRPFKPMAKGQLPIFGDGRPQVEKPAATMDDKGYTYSFYYSLVSLRVLKDKIAHICV